ncbi:cystinosin homolog isoform X4 [Photinus pyralis]|uniref:cystinosin homolog isoform X4 n=2 Tax=Photinus pyralis TaxID=7054 RepID=UPI001266FC60|nr:cystinosin homolog isoform X4 [Photinus pyralis]
MDNGTQYVDGFALLDLYGFNFTDVKIQMYPLHTRRKIIGGALILLTVLQSTQCDILTFSNDHLALQLGEQLTFSLRTPPNISDTTVHLVIQHNDILQLIPTDVALQANQTSYKIEITGTSAGHSEVAVNSTNPHIDVAHAFMRVKVYKSNILDILSFTIGWVYFIAWSISFYPQIYTNYKRRSVVGLNFDFLVLNIVGFALYSVFNLGLFAVPEIEQEYFERYPRGLNPVKVNDIVFAVHAFAATLLTIIQCFLYERADQKVSMVARIILGIYSLFIAVSVVLSSVNVIHWLDFLYYCSYVKLSITLIKYIPQAYMNYKRKSTMGWSIGNILLDFTGGILSMLQMILDSYNYNDWVSIFGDPTKFGLGLFSVIFDIFFMIQHYLLYKNCNYEETPTLPDHDECDTDEDDK